MSDVTLTVNGVSYGGWTSSRVRMSLTELIPSFEVQFMDAWQDGMKPVPIVNDDDFVLKIDGEKVITGVIDDDGVEYTERTYSMSARGRARTRELNDCSNLVEGSQLRNVTYLQAANALCKSYSITVSAENGVDMSGKMPYFQPEPGSTPFDALQELERKLGATMQTDVDGNLVFTRTNAVPLRTVLRYGDNIKSCRRSRSCRDRYSRYIFKGATEADDDWYGEAAADIVGEVYDLNIKRFRPLVIVAEHKGYREDLGRRAITERNKRAARANRISYTVHGWEHLDGIWMPNRIVPVEDSRLGFYENMLIESVDLVKNAKEGDVAHLDLVGPEAYDLGEPVASKPRKSRRW